GPLHAALQALPVVTCVARVSEAHPGPGIPVTRRRDWRPSPDAALGLIRATLLMSRRTCVARVSEAHPGTGIPAARHVIGAHPRMRPSALSGLRPVPA